MWLWGVSVCTCTLGPKLQASYQLKGRQRCYCPEFTERSCPVSLPRHFCRVLQPEGEVEEKEASRIPPACLPSFSRKPHPSQAQGSRMHHGKSTLSTCGVVKSSVI